MRREKRRRGTGKHGIEGQGRTKSSLVAPVGTEAVTR